MTNGRDDGKKVQFERSRKRPDTTSVSTEVTEFTINHPNRTASTNARYICFSKALPFRMTKGHYAGNDASRPIPLGLPMIVSAEEATTIDQKVANRFGLGI
jgi:hypothetical protein